jgi:hypothetical protein
MFPLAKTTSDGFKRRWRKRCGSKVINAGCEYVKICENM